MQPSNARLWIDLISFGIKNKRNLLQYPNVLIPIEFNNELLEITNFYNFEQLKKAFSSIDLMEDCKINDSKDEHCSNALFPIDWKW